MKIQKAILIQTRNIALGEAVLCAVMCGVFAVIRRFDWTVPLGAVLGGTWAVLNFFLMGLTVQKAASQEENAKRMVQSSYTMRSLAMLVVAAVGVLVPCFHPVASIVPLFFPQLTIFLMKALKLYES